MRGYTRADSAPSPYRPPSRSSSISSLASAPNGRFSLGSPPQVDLSPSYVAAAAASEIVSALHTHPTRDNDPNYERAAIFSEEALALINSFLDFLLYNMLAASRSSALDPVRHAVEYVVKGKLGQQAIQAGEYELEELLNEEDEDELASMEHSPDVDASWDADVVWKRTRLKIFTYMRLSEIEEEDEDDFIDEEAGLDGRAASNQYSRRAGLVSWPAMIFLTGALERVAEQCVKDAGESAYNRTSISRPGTRDGFFDEADMLIVAEQDVKKLALSQLLGRIWRTWKHTIPRPSPRPSQWKSFTHERAGSILSDSSFSSRRPSNALTSVSDEQRDAHREEPMPQPPQQFLSRTSATPKSPRPTSDGSNTGSKKERHGPRRSRSFGRFPVVVPGLADGGSWRSNRAEVPPDMTSEQRLHRMRSSSLPPPSVQAAGLPPGTIMVEQQPLAEAAAESPTQKKRKSRNSRDMAAQTAKAIPRPSEPDLSTKASKRSSRDYHKRRSKDVRRSRDLTASANGRSRVPNDELSSNQALHAPAPATTSSGPSDDEYDPFRADATTPPLNKSAISGASERSSPHPQPVQETLRSLADRDSLSPTPTQGLERPVDMTATLNDGAISNAMFGSTSSIRKAKKPAPLDMSATGSTASRAQAREVHPQPARTPSGRRQRSTFSNQVPAKDISPAQVSAGRADGSRTPSSSKLQRMGTSDTTGSAPYHTPRDSPTNFDDRPIAQSSTSDPQAIASTAKPTSLRSPRMGGESVAQKYPNKAPVTRHHDKASSLSGSRSDKEFYEMMSGNETVKRSLTPKTLTEIEAVDSPTIRQQQVKSTYGPPSPTATQFPISEGPESPISSAEALSPISKKLSNIAAIRQAAEARKAESGSPSSAKSPTRNGYTAREAREAREQPYRTSDMADFIRSTAPTSPDQAPRLVSPTRPSPTSPGSKASLSAPIQPSVKSVVPNTSRAAAKKALIRTPVMERQANDDLISFLNEGPPGAQINKSKSFETTNSRATDNMGIGTLSPANRSSSQMSQGMAESVNSYSGLLPKTSPGINATVPRSVPQPPPPPKTVPTPTDSNSGPPGRKQRRVKDPYAIESDDDDADVLTGLPAREEVGLVDFLRSTEPPVDNGPRRFNSPPPSSTSPPPTNSNSKQTNVKNLTKNRKSHLKEMPMGTSSTAVGGPRPIHKTIPSNEEIKRDRGDLALPDFLKDERVSEEEMPVRPGKMRRNSSREGSKGMRGLWRKIGVNG